MNSQAMSDTTVNNVLRNMYMLLSMVFVFSALTCFIGMQMGISPGVGIVMSLAGLGLLFYMSLSNVLDSSKALPLTFLFTGIEGLSIAPIVAHYVSASGGMVVLQALSGTAAIFLALSFYVLTTRKDFSFMRGFLFVALIGALLAMVGLLVAVMVFGASASTALVSLGMSYIIVLIMSGYILLDTSDVIHGLETNYVRATVGMFINLLNIFTSLLNILSGDD